MFERVDPELVEPLKAYLEITGGIDLGDIPRARQRVAELAVAAQSGAPPVEGVSTRQEVAPGIDGDPDVALRVYTGPEPAGALLWIHGGGYVIGSAESDDLRAQALAASTRCVVVSVDYRLAPEHAYPAPLNDCYAGLRWLHANASSLGVDVGQIAVGGASAGAGLAAGLALLARDRGEVPVCFQLLIYPMLDDRNTRPADDSLRDTLPWSRENNVVGWASYLGRAPGGAVEPVYAAPARALDLEGLPPAFINVGTEDLFLGEDIDYAQRLIAAGVPTELHVYPGGYHAFDGLAPQSRLARQFEGDVHGALQKAFA